MCSSDLVNKLNLLMWLFWDTDIGGIAVGNLQMLGGDELEFATDQNEFKIDLINRKFSDGKDICFGELEIK